MSLNFPPLPQNTGTQYTGDNGVIYNFDGIKWVGLAPNSAPGSNSITNNGYVVQVDFSGNLIVPVGSIIKDENGTALAGSNGVSGPRGPQGVRGPQGPQGVIGITGARGPQGPEGVEGPSGTRGQAGPQGVNGSVGSRGPQGPDGIAGNDGAPGAVGPSGPTGQRGLTGEQGISVTLVGSTSTVGGLPLSGNPGDGWIVTDNGDLWFWSTAHSQWEDIGQIVGPQGDKGDQGDQGLPGDRGPQGPSGARGLQGADGIDGPQGPQGDVGPSGANGSTGLRGPQGPQGDKGDQGDAGPAGGQEYFPTNVPDWVGSPTVATFSQGLDELAGRITTVETNGSPRWDATPAEEGCPIFAELTPDHFQAFTQKSHITLENTGDWYLGSGWNGSFVNGVGNDISLTSFNGIVTVQSGLSQWGFGGDGNLTLPDSTRLNSGGINVRNSAEIKTTVDKDIDNNIVNSSIALQAGNGGISSQVFGPWDNSGNFGSGGPTLVFAGVENLNPPENIPGFAGFVAIDPNVTSQYAVAVREDGKIFVSFGEPVTTTEYTAALGVLTDDINGETGVALLNGIAVTPSITALTGKFGISMSTDRGTVLFGNQPEIGVVSHFHIMKEDPSTVDLFLGDDFDYVKLPYVSTLTNTGVEVGTNGNTWKFNKDGSTTFPNNTILSNRVIIRGTDWAELNWQNTNFESLPNELIDAYVGVDDTGPYMVNIAINNDVTDSNFSVWSVDTNGNLVTSIMHEVSTSTDVGDIVDVDGNSIIYTIASETAPTRAPAGRLWYNSVEGRMYIRYGDIWVDASPTVVPPVTTYLDGLTVEGTTISPVDSTGTVSIQTGADNVWTFSNNGNLILPNNARLEQDGGESLLISGKDGVSVWSLNTSSSSGAIHTVSGDNGNEGVAIWARSVYTDPWSVWGFGTNGDLTLPNGGKISEGTANVPGSTASTIVLTPNGSNSEQKLLIYPTTGGEGNHIHLTSGALDTTSIFLGNDSQYIRTRADGAMVIGTNDTIPDESGGKRWIFGTDGNLALPGDLTFSAGSQIYEGTDDGGHGWRTGLNIIGGIGSTSTNAVRIYPYGDDGKGFNMGTVNVMSDRVEIKGNNQGTGGPGMTWTFAHDGTLTMPGAVVNSTILKSTTGALDLHNSINKLSDGLYTLADGVEGQIMYLVPQASVTVAANVGVTVANYRTASFTGTGGALVPFRVTNGDTTWDGTGLCTLIFTDGAWQQNGGLWN